jgi:hypothetical protein
MNDNPDDKYINAFWASIHGFLKKKGKGPNGVRTALSVFFYSFGIIGGLGVTTIFTFWALFRPRNDPQYGSLILATMGVMLIGFTLLGICLHLSEKLEDYNNPSAAARQSHQVQLELELESPQIISSPCLPHQIYEPKNPII